MELGKPGWLAALLAEATTEHEADVSASAPERSLGSARAKARAYLRRVLRSSGLLYGTPQHAGGSKVGAAPEEILFVAVLRTLVRIALDIAVLSDAPPRPRVEQVLLVLAANTELSAIAEEIQKKIA